ncbi:hypothetical protein UY3_08031 [Chelonia mydas]|uniref:Uncharacterized protein n=1 Tax=Chelonia mydas TaxID=8469 RepID=M7BCD5_CHEMY|nr:hypothetical protein UY3_08031 [Chelonia mydas]
MPTLANLSQEMRSVFLAVLYFRNCFEKYLHMHIHKPLTCTIITAFCTATAESADSVTQQKSMLWAPQAAGGLLEIKAEEEKPKMEREKDDEDCGDEKVLLLF